MDHASLCNITTVNYIQDTVYCVYIQTHTYIHVLLSWLIKTRPIPSRFLPIARQKTTTSNAGRTNWNNSNLRSAQQNVVSPTQNPHLRQLQSLWLGNPPTTTYPGFLIVLMAFFQMRASVLNSINKRVVGIKFLAVENIVRSL